MPKGKYGSSIQASLAKCLTNNEPIIKGNYVLDPLTSGSTGNPYTLTSDYATVAVVKVCGYVFGRFCNSADVTRTYCIGNEKITGNHAEDQILSAWDEAWDSDVMKELRVARALQGLPLYVTIKISKSPCHVCAEKLVRFKNTYHVNLRIKTLRLYAGDEGTNVNAFALLYMVSNGVAVKFWDVLGKGYQKKTKLGQPHELKYMSQHLKQTGGLVEMEEDGKGEKKEQTAVEAMGTQFRKLVGGMHSDGLATLAKALEQMREKKTSYPVKGKLSDAQKRKVGLQKDFIAKSDLNYLDVVTSFEDVLSPDVYRFLKEEKFELDCIHEALRIYFGADYDKHIANVNY
jgi:hypothetical protein